jgi:hypothetical protein
MSFHCILEKTVEKPPQDVPSRNTYEVDSGRANAEQRIAKYNKKATKIFFLNETVSWK